ncbi:MAG: lipopolysaccharide biosynthesis protein [Gammaproteobacteria bacterium]|nr:lipopolysaccharide biosynthesis protein [Gammaproteobacteria bacterium]
MNTPADALSMMEAQPGVKDYIAALSRRRGRIFVVAGVVLLISLALAFGLPSVYRSSATILIEEQDIPSDLVRSTVTSFADQRIQVISQRVMTRANLTRIIEKYNLYADDRKDATMEEVIDQMRKDIQLNRVSADVIDPRSGRPTQATIAFNISYDGETPEVVQRVTNELVSLYLTENIRNRTQKAEEATDFLADDAKRLSDQLSEIETRLAAFKKKNMDRLPELVDLNMTLLDRTERDLQSVKAQITSHEERIIYLQGQLALVDPVAAATSQDGIMEPKARLKLLELKALSMASNYGEDYPDLVKVRNEIKSLREQLGIATSVDSEARAKLKDLQDQLAAARARYSEEHPDVVHLRNAVAGLEAQIAADERKADEQAVASGASGAGVDSDANNPTYITLRAQLESANLELKSLKTQERKLQEKMTDYESRLQKTPEAEREYRDLTREHDNILQRFQQAKAKQMEAQIAQELEKERKAERFTLIEPPELPELPVKPNRKALMFLGFVLAIGAGLGYGFSAHALDGSVRGLGAVESLTGELPLVAVPYLKTESERRRDSRYRARATMAFVVAVLGVLAMVHFLWKPLDVIWFVLLNRLGVS